jgi:hypothetical protein
VSPVDWAVAGAAKARAILANPVAVNKAARDARGRQALAMASNSPAVDRALDPAKVRLVRKVVRVSMDCMVASP